MKDAHLRACVCVYETSGVTLVCKRVRYTVCVCVCEGETVV